MDQALVAHAFNEWMRRNIENPEQFEREFQVVGVYLAETAAGREPNYGEGCAAYLAKLMQEVG